MNLKGYIFSRPFLGERVPQHVQNIVLRDYCSKNNFNFLLSSTEYTSKNSVFILFEILDNLDSFDGILFYSLLQLPENRNIRFNLYKKIIKKKKQIHFAVENISVKNEEELRELEQIFLIKQCTLDEDNKRLIKKPLTFVSYRHTKTKRDYLKRMMNEKVRCMSISKKYGKDYWDGDRKFGYGGYQYIEGYHTFLAKKIIDKYKLNHKSKILDLGCGKGYLLYELKKILGCNQIYGLDISKYAIKNAKKEVMRNISFHDIRKKLKFADKSFDLVISINVLHNLKLEEVYYALKEIERVAKFKYICVESYRNIKEQFNLQCWALTAETIIDVKSWKWIFDKAGYVGDYEFIYFD
jgi:sporadic carbohydrate cluster protein (TIGR04323 family)